MNVPSSCSSVWQIEGKDFFKNIFDGNNEMAINAKFFFWECNDLTNHEALRVSANRFAAQFGWPKSSVDASLEYSEDPL
jgi:hypothetical protein